MNVSVMVLTVALLWITQAQAIVAPVCPTGSNDPYPPFSQIGDPPTVATWRDLLALPANCSMSLSSPAELTVALAGRFTQSGQIGDIAARLGAVSKTQGLPYWSVTDQEWRTLVSEAYALDTRAPDSQRADFTAQEILSGQTQYFVQNDTRSWGLNTYSVKAISSSADHLLFESRNVSPITLGPITLFKPDDVHSLLFINRMDDTTWSYFSLTVIKRTALAAREKSLINRQAAFYRFLIGQAPDQNPPLAP